MHALRPKWAWQESLEVVGIDTVIQEETPINGTFYGGNIHVVPHYLKQGERENATNDLFIFSVIL